MYAPTSIPFVRRTRATLRSAELGFFGVVVYTRVQTPRFCGAPASAGTLLRKGGEDLGLRTSWLIVGMLISLGGAPRRLLCNPRSIGRCAPKVRKRKRWRRNAARLLPIRRRSEFSCLK